MSKTLMKIAKVLQVEKTATDIGGQAAIPKLLL
jgi:hypothetical protein